MTTVSRCPLFFHSTHTRVPAPFPLSGRHSPRPTPPPPVRRTSRRWPVGRLARRPRRSEGGGPPLHAPRDRPPVRRHRPWAAARQRPHGRCCIEIRRPAS